MTGSFVGLVFAALWLSVAIGATPAPWATIMGVAGGVTLLATALMVVRRRTGRAGRFDGRWFAGAVIFEIAAIAAVQLWLAQHHHADLLLPAVGIIVGLHFIGVWRAIRLDRFVWLATALVLINLAALLAPVRSEVRLMMSGYGSSSALLATVAL